MSLAYLKVGDYVTIHDNYYGPRKISTVAKTDKVKITLADDSKWNLRSGQMYGSKNPYYTGPRIYPTRDTDADHIEKRVCLQVIERAVFKELPLPYLRTIRDAIKAAAAAALPQSPSD